MFLPLMRMSSINSDVTQKSMHKQGAIYEYPHPALKTSGRPHMSPSFMRHVSFGL